MFRDYDVEHVGRPCTSRHTGIDHQRGMKGVDERQCRNGGIDLADARSHGHDLAAGDCAGVVGDVVDGNYAMVAEQRHEQVKFLTHRHYYGYFHCSGSVSRGCVT